MTLSRLLSNRHDQDRPVRVGLIGAGKLGSMVLAQARWTRGLHVAAVVDHDPERAHTALALAQWPPLKVVARSLAQALDSGSTWVTRDAEDLFGQPGLDVVVEASGDAVAATRHALAAIGCGVSVIMATAEADALAGPLLAARAQAAGVIYSLAYGDQPALICELVDWARTCGFEVAAAGKGTKYLPGYRVATPETVWSHYGMSQERARMGGVNARVLTAQLDGTTAAIEMASVANATGLEPPTDGLSFAPCGVHDLARLMKPRSAGGLLEGMGQVEVVSSEERDGRHVVGDLRWGVFVTVRAPGFQTASCFTEYGLVTDESGDYAALWRPFHLVGMEMGVSVASVALRREATGCPVAFVADAVAVAKRDLGPGDELDGSGGFTVSARLMPAAAAVQMDALPIGLTRGVRVVRAVEAGRVLTWADVALDPEDEVVAFRREMEKSRRGN
ncbi:MAG: NAD(P)H-dependent oxidoreductase [Solirubrobacterales bacterium]